MFLSMAGTLKQNTKDRSSLEVDSSDYTHYRRIQARRKGIGQGSTVRISLRFLPFQVNAGRKAAYE